MIDIEAIRARAAEFGVDHFLNQAASELGSYWNELLGAVEDRTVLLAEVDRLRAEAEKMMARLWFHEHGHDGQRWVMPETQTCLKCGEVNPYLEPR